MNVFYSIISVKGSEVVVSNPFKYNYSLSILCDKARQISLDNENVVVSIYKHFCDSPSYVKLLYRFINGLLVRC